MIALLMAGQHTSSTTTTWMVLYLAQNPQYVDMIMKEQNIVLGEESTIKPSPLTFDHIKKLTFLGHCMKETLRLRPPIITLMRKVVEPQNLSVSLSLGRFENFVSKINQTHVPFLSTSVRDVIFLA